MNSFLIPMNINKTRIPIKKEYIDNSNLPAISMKEFIGQKKLKQMFTISITAAKKQNKCLSHCLFVGGAGRGKTTFAHIVAHNANLFFREFAGQNLQKIKDVEDILRSLQPHDCIFIDEAHLMKTKAAETLLVPMAEGKYTFKNKDVNGSYFEKIEFEPFCIMLATTEPEKLKYALRTRCKHTGYFDEYRLEDIVGILHNYTQKLNMNVNDTLLFEIAKRARFTPRIAKNFLDDLIDIVICVDNKKMIATSKMVKYLFNMKEIDINGLDAMDMHLLKVLYEANRSLGLGTWASMAGIKKDTLMQFHEPYLLRIGCVQIGNKGRCLSVKIRKWFNKINRRNSNGKTY